MHIGHVALRVPDLAVTTEFAIQVLGLKVTSRSSSVALLSANEKHHELELIAANESGFDHIGLEVESEVALERLRDRALAAGARLLESRSEEPGLGRAVRFVGPGDIVYEVYTAMERRPLAPESYLVSRARRLGHLTFQCEGRDAVLAFWLDGLGFRLSDEAEGLAWTRCDVDHHGLAVGPRAEGNVLHHQAWEVQDWGALRDYCDKLAVGGLRLLWGPVRHGPGFNLATYLPDVDGGIIEVYTDLLRIHDEASYQPTDWSQEPDALNLWGPIPTEAFFAAGLPVLPPVD